MFTKYGAYLAGYQSRYVNHRSENLYSVHGGNDELTAAFNIGLHDSMAASADYSPVPAPMKSKEELLSALSKLLGVEVTAL